ncbi:rho GTPase-activating protein REN1-like isoform X2 [Prosopis cineraria]|uniref:rho GTPase-activating protein REN1-like isoform X2 n=1 Tax=Prosopis cineraria TaxID=364024 RepID=UPI00240F4FF1|nr:rho GTPase-activating protein REN1-like isoform X2 [Prosopis cineraria]
MLQCRLMGFFFLNLYEWSLSGIAILMSGDGGTSLPSSQHGPPEHQCSRGSNGNAIFKTGPLYISSKGIGWTSWKKRWFVLTRTSLVFFRSDPSAVPQKGGEVNLTLGGIDLNNSGSVVVKADKKLLTVLFPDGRAFTLKADTAEDLHEWKTALENALAQAPGASDVTGENGIFRNDQTDSIDISLDQSKDVEPAKSTVVGRPILLALEDDDGAPSFLEKALRFIEEHGVKVEGILRQAAAVDDVEYRVQEYEQGKTEFSADEDPHVVADCLKFVLRELLSSPVPASCCKALLEACRTERAGRISAICAAICETFPEPNRRLLQRILQMMQTVASHKAVNRMSSSAVAACMAPLLLRPLLAGECDIENDFDVGGDGSVQLLQAAAAANHAQTIVITLLEEYDSIFGEEGTGSPGIYSDSEESGSGSEEGTEDEESYDDEDYDDDCDDECDEESIQESDADAEGSETEDSGCKDDKKRDHSRSDVKSSGDKEDPKVNQISSQPSEVSLSPDVAVKSRENLTSSTKTARAEKSSTPANLVEVVSTDQSTAHNSTCPGDNKSMDIYDDPAHAPSHTILGRTSAMKNLTMETVDSSKEAAEIENLEAIKIELQNQITEESNANLQSYLEKQKKSMHERRLALEQDVARLREQLQKEKNYWATREAGNKYSPRSSSDSTSDEKTKADLEEIALIEADLTKLRQRIDDFGRRFNLQHEHTSNHETKLKNKLDTEDAVNCQSQIERSKNKEIRYGGTESENEKKSEPTSLLNKYTPQATSKKVGAKVEHQASNFTTSRLTKLSTRLNFLKERRNQIQQPQPSLSNKSRVSETHSVSNPEKGRATDSTQPSPIPDKGSGKETYSLQNSDKMRKSDGQSTHHQDKWNQNQSSERGRSEGYQSYNVDKGR